MSSEEAIYVIDEKLSSFSVTSLLKNRDKQWLQPGMFPVGGGNSVHGSGNGEALPISPDGTLQAGILYLSSIDPMVRFYLPQYQLHVENGRYTTSLKYRGANDDPNGPLAWLTIELDAVAPQASRVTLREIDHQAVVRIGYHMPINDRNGNPIVAPPPVRVQDGSVIDDFVGNWTNVDANTNGMTRLQIAKVDAGTLSYHGFGKCSPTDCDWGVINVPFTAMRTSGTYTFSFKTTRIDIQRTGDLLTAVVFDHYNPGDGRPDHTNTYVFKRLDAPSTPPANTGPTLWIEVGALNPTTNNTRRCQTAILLKPDFDRLYQIMTDSSYGAWLEIQCFATIGRRTWRQIVIGNINTTTQLVALSEKQVLFSNALNANTLAAVKPDVLTQAVQPVVLEQNTLEEQMVRAPELMQVFVSPTNIPLETLVKTQDPPTSFHSPIIIDHLSPQVLEAETLKVNMASEMPQMASVVTLAPSVAVANSRVQATVDSPIRSFAPILTSSSPVFMRSSLLALPIAEGQTLPTATTRSLAAAALAPTLPQMTLARAFAPPLAETLAASDLLVKVGAAPITAIPVRAVTDPYGLPALLKVSVETSEEITPFSFPKDTNAYMFDIPGDLQPSTHHVLIRSTIIAGNATGTFYQDSAFQDVFYYQPTEFRLSRLATYPYLPDLLITFYDVVSQDANTATTIHYRVVLTYRALPYMDSQLLEMARTQFTAPNVIPRFTSLEPVGSKLFLTLQSQQVERASANISFTDGIVDNVELSSTDFEQIFTHFQAPDGLGLRGSLQIQLSDNTQTTIPVNLSLVSTAGPVFDRTFNGPVAGTPGQYQVTLRNRIESAVHIDSLSGVLLAPNTVASPVTAAAGTIVKPGDTLVLTYQVTPAEAVVTDIEPTMTTSIQLELANQTALWRSLMVNQGYTSDTFPVHVSSDASWFGPPPKDMELITGVLVEFQDDCSTTLTSTQLAADVTLRMPLLGRLLKDPNAQQYLYRVTVLHASGPGVRSKWQPGEGDLSVNPVLSMLLTGA